MPSYKLTYFDFSGRAEISRLIFACAGQEYEDCRITQEQWSELKPNTPFGSLPVLDITNDDGTKQKLAQSLSIARFLAREFNLAGKTSFEQAQVDMVLEQINDLFNKFAATVFLEKDETVKKTNLAKFLSEDVPFLFNKMNMRLGMEGRQFFIGDSLTAVDLMVVALFETLGSLPVFDTVSILANYPNLEKHVAKIKALKAVEAHNAKCNKKK